MAFRDSPEDNDNGGTSSENKWMDTHSSLIIIFLLIILVVVAIVIVVIICKRKRRRNPTDRDRCYINDGCSLDNYHSSERNLWLYPQYRHVTCFRCNNPVEINRNCSPLHNSAMVQNQSINQSSANKMSAGFTTGDNSGFSHLSNNNELNRYPTQNECEQTQHTSALSNESGVNYSDSDNQDYSEEIRPIIIHNQELFADIPSQLLVVSQRSQTITILNKEVVYIARRVSNKGDNLVLDGMGISLYVPPGAVNDGEIKTVVLVLNWDLSDNPYMSDKQALISPVVYVGPHDLKLEKQCTLYFKHCSFDSRHIRVMKSETELVECKDWKEHCKAEDTGMCCITSDECQLQINTFTLYTCIQSPSDTDDCRKWLQVAAFSRPLKSNTNYQEVRLYFLNKTPCALQWSIQNEAKFGGQLMGPEKVYLFYGNAQDMFINLRYLSEGWEIVDKDIDEHIPYINIWHGKCPHVTMCFKKHLYPRELTFKLFLYQYLLENEGGNFIAHMFETQYDNDTGGSKHEIVLKLPSRPNDLIDSDCKAMFHSHADPQVHLHFKSDEQRMDLDKVEVATKDYYPYNLKIHLKILLDPPSPFDRNWRALAAALDKERCIRYLETKESPTEHLLSYAESRKISLETLADILSSIQREDSAQLVKDYIPSNGKIASQNDASNATQHVYNYNIT